MRQIFENVKSGNITKTIVLGREKKMRFEHNTLRNHFLKTKKINQSLYSPGGTNNQRHTRVQLPIGALGPITVLPKLPSCSDDCILLAKSL